MREILTSHPLRAVSHFQDGRRCYLGTQSARSCFVFICVTPFDTFYISKECNFARGMPNFYLRRRLCERCTVCPTISIGEREPFLQGMQMDICLTSLSCEEQISHQNPELTELFMKVLNPVELNRRCNLSIYLEYSRDGSHAKQLAMFIHNLTPTLFGIWNPRYWKRRKAF